MFFKQILGIDNVKSRFLQSQYQLLRDVVQAYVIRMPFQLVTGIGRFRPVDRKSLNVTWESITLPNFRGCGGGCAQSNIFLKLQLESIGYKINQVQATFDRTGIPLAHNLSVVQIPHKGTLKDYLIDVGAGICVHEPVPLDELPYEGRAGGFTYRYEWVDPVEKKAVRRSNVGGDPVLGKKTSEFHNPNNYTTYLRPSNFVEVKHTVEAVLKDLSSTFLHRGLYLFRYLSIGEDDFEAITIYGKDVIKITKETTTVIESYSSYMDMAPAVLKYFPMISQDDVKIALEHFSLPLEEAAKLPSTLPPGFTSMVSPWLP